MIFIKLDDVEWIVLIIGPHQYWNHCGQILLELEYVWSKIVVVQLSLIGMECCQSRITEKINP